MAGLKQISVFLSNKSGRIAEVTKVLAENDIDICALSIADGENYGSLRLITKNLEKTKEVLKNNNFLVNVTDVLGIKIPNTPGALSKILCAFNEEDISVEYIYAFVGVTGKHARVIIRVNDNEKALEVLDKMNVHLVTDEDIC